MKVLYIYITVVIIQVVIFLFKKNYRKNIFGKLDRKKYHLIFLFGVAAFIYDFVDKKIVKINSNNTRKKLEKINAANISDEEVYIYQISKIALALIIFFIITFLGGIKCIDNTFSKEKSVNILKRYEYGDGDRRYNLYATLENQDVNKITLNIPERKYNEDEAIKLIDKNYDKLINLFKGKNKSIKEITKDVNLVTEIDETIKVDWTIDNTDYLDYSGRIIWENIETQAKINIQAICSLGDFSKEFDITIIANKEKRSTIEKLSEEINKYIQEYSEYDKEI